MITYTFEEIKKRLLKSIKEYRCEAELRLLFKDKRYEYMIIIYDDHCSFQRCGREKEQSGEYNYATLDALYKANQVDDIILERDWKNIVDIDCIDFDILGLW
jgi:hypothetical protein